MGRVIAVANQKGGVAKTTTTHTLAAALVEHGRDVLIVDLDPQACLTFAAGVDPDALDETVHQALVGGTPLTDILFDVEGIHLAPANIDLAGAEVALLTRTGREMALERALRPVRDAYDYVFIDCPPSLGVLTINGLTAANEVLIPLQAETLSSRGVAQLLQTIDDVRAFTNPDLKVLGAVVTMYDPRTRLGRAVIDEIPTRHGLAVLQPPIPKSVKAAEAPGLGRSVLSHAGSGKVAEAYRALARTLESS